MYRKDEKRQISFKDFYLPFGGHLDGNNRWVELESLIPWGEFEEEYEKGFSEKGMGAPAKDFRMALGSEIIKKRLNISDDEVVEQIRENPYLQYFVGKKGFSTEKPFDGSMMAIFRERLGPELIHKVNEKIIEARENKKKEKRARNKKRKPGAGGATQGSFF
jgi:hypothetical protein